MADLPRPEYLETYFTVEFPLAGRPRSFGIVTAYDPEGRRQSEEANKRADADLRYALDEAGLEPVRAVGGSKDGSHREPGWAVTADSPESLRPFSRRFRQLAFFWVVEDDIFVLNTDGIAMHPAGKWSERHAQWAA